MLPRQEIFPLESLYTETTKLLCHSSPTSCDFHHISTRRIPVVVDKLRGELCLHQDLLKNSKSPSNIIKLMAMRIFSVSPTIVTCLLLSLPLVSTSHAAAAYRGSACRCLPGDACWPSLRAWAHLNATVGGRLIATTLLAAPCHDPTYNAAECAQLQSQWIYPQTQ